MYKSERLIKIWMSINRKKKFTAREIADEMGVSIRTVTRDLDTLTLFGVPLYPIVGRGGGYEILRNDILPPVEFSEEEVLSLFFAYNILGNMTSTPFDMEIELIKNKLYQKVSANLLKKIIEMEEYIWFIVPERNVNNQFLRKIFLASINKKIIEISYDRIDAKENISLIPVGIYTYQGFWYFVACNEKDKKYKIYRVDRVCSLTFSKNKYNEKLMTLKEWYEQGLNNSEKVTIKLKVTPSSYRKITNYWILKGKIDKSNKEWYQITFCTLNSQVDFIIDEILKLGNEVIVNSPSEVKEKIMKKIRGMYQLYFKGKGEL